MSTTPNQQQQQQNHHRKLHLVNNQLFSRLNVFNNENDETPQQEQALSKAVAQQSPRDQSPIAIGGTLKNLIQKHDFDVFLPNRGSIDVTQHTNQINTLTPAGAVQQVSTTTPSSTAGQATGQLSKEKSRAILSAVLQTANRVTPSLSLKRSIEKSKALILSPAVSTMYVYLLSGVMLQPDEKKIRSQITVLSRSFLVNSESDHNSLVNQASLLTQYHYAELAYYIASSPPLTVAEPKSPRQTMLRTRSKFIHTLPTSQAMIIATINSANHLKVKDKASGSSDPYVCVHLTTQEDYCHKSKSGHSHRTSTKKGELNPVWDETFVIKSTKVEDNTLILSVFDSDLITKDDFMGTVHIPLGSGHSPLIPLNAVNVDVFLQPKEKKQGFFSRLGHNKDTKKDDIEFDSSNHGLGSIKFSYYYVKRDLDRNELIDAVPEDIQKLIKINHEQHMIELVEYIFSTPNFKSTFIFPEELHLMLRDFELRVGLYSFTRLDCILANMIEIFSITSQQLNLINVTLSLLQKDLIVDRTITLTNDINMKLTVTIKGLKQIFKNVISRYGLSFPVNMNEKGEITGITEENGKLLTLSIQILKQLSSIRCFQKGVTDETSKFNQKIDKYVMNYFKIFFGMVKENSEVSIEDSKDFQNIVGLLDVYDAIELQITNDIDIYSKLFGSDFSKKSAVAYYNLLKEETTFILSKEKGVCMETFTLLKKIQKLHSTTLKLFIKDISIMDLNSLFEIFIDMWVVQARTQFSTWMTRSLRNEQWLAIDPKNKILHSSSVMDLFQIFEIGKNHLGGLKLSIEKQLMDFLNTVVNQSYLDYLDTLMDVVLSELGEDAKQKDQNTVDKFIAFLKDIGNSNSSTGSTSTGGSGSTTPRSRSQSVSGKDRSISLPICVQLNCIETSRQLLDDFIDDLINRFPDLNDQINSVFIKSISYAKRQIEYLTDLVTGKIGRVVSLFVGDILERAIHEKKYMLAHRGMLFDEPIVTSTLQPMIDYLTTELALLSSNLYQPTFDRFIRGVWMCIWKECERILFPDQSLQKITEDNLLPQLYMILSVYKELETFFYSDGDGMRLELLRKHATPLVRMLPVFFASTPILIDIHKHLFTDITTVGSKSDDATHNSIIADNGASPVLTSTFIIKSMERLPTIPTPFELPDLKSDETLSILEVHIMSPLASRQKESEAVKYIKANKDHYHSRYLIAKFNLPHKNLNVVEKFKCKSSLGIPTVLYLVDDYLCITTLLSYSETNTAISYKSISKLLKHVLQERETLSVIVNEKSYDLWAFKDSKKSKLYKTIVHLASKFNESIKIDEPTISTRNQEIEFEFFANLYKLPKSEKILFNFTCMKKGLYGRMTLTNHYFCYQNHVTFSTEKYEWSEITDIKKANSLFTSGIQLTIRNEKIKFNGFQNRDIAFNQILEVKSKFI